MMLPNEAIMASSESVPVFSTITILLTTHVHSWRSIVALGVGVRSGRDRSGQKETDEC